MVGAFSPLVPPLVAFIVFCFLKTLEIEHCDGAAAVNPRIRLNKSRLGAFVNAARWLQVVPVTKNVW